MEIIIDIGNSAIKIGNLDSADRILHITRHCLADFNPSNNLEFPPGTRLIIGRSGPQQILNDILAFVEHKKAIVQILDKTTSLPFASNYAPGQAGIDRLANVAAAIQLTPGASIIIDAGSAITLEAVSDSQVFLGGAIFPGLSLQAGILHKNTDELPSVQPYTSTVPPIGTNTKAAILSGITHGISGAIQQLIRLTTQQPGIANPQLYITGGNAPFIAETLPQLQLIIVPDLTLRGLKLLDTYQTLH